MYSYTFILVAMLFVGVLLFTELGRRVGKARAKEGSDPGKAGTGSVDAAVFGLLGLLIAFTFSGAAARFDARRMLIVNEANALGTAYLRIDLLPTEAQPDIRKLMREYADARIATYKSIPDMDKVWKEKVLSEEIAGRIWSKVVAACQAAPSPAVTSLVIPAYNDMFDLATTRAASADLHVPAIVIATLLVIAMGCALLAGFDMSTDRRRSAIHFAGFALVMSFVVFVILDLEYPRVGLIRLDSFDKYMIDARQAMR
ncbi:MAG: DUF4239 domain-containing protein [Planctomycetes bacterium]|nr:DUF4239 domain-containing protein [Planctomycetota bacterium]